MTAPSEQHLSLALEAAMSRFGGMVRRIGLRHRLSEADVDDLMQEVRIRLWRARETGEQISETSTSYVYRTAVSAALDLIRRGRSKRATLTETLEDHHVETVGTARPGPHGEVEASELAAQVAAAIDTIAPSRRPVVRMYLAGHPREEIAQLMGWTEAKTRNLLYRGLADLRERLVERGIGLDYVQETAS